jgi:lipoate-protein ligase A
MGMDYWYIEGIGVSVGMFYNTIDLDKLIKFVNEKEMDEGLASCKNKLVESIVSYKNELKEEKEEPDYYEIMDLFDGERDFLEFITEKVEYLTLAIGDDDDYIIYEKKYPWDMTDEEKNYTREDIIQLIVSEFSKILKDDVDIAKEIDDISKVCMGY